MSEFDERAVFAALDGTPDPAFADALLDSLLREIADDIPSHSSPEQVASRPASELRELMAMTDLLIEDRTRRSRSTLIAVAAGVALLAGIGAAVFAASTDDADSVAGIPTVEEPEASEFAENIVGIWHRISSDPMYMRFLEDGTMNFAESPEKVSEGLGDQWKYRVEGTQFFVEEIRGQCETRDDVVQPLPENRPPASTGSYQVHLLGNGNLRFVVIEDECRQRTTFLYGRPDDGITREWEPVSSK